MGNKRIGQLSFMMADITGINTIEAEKIIKNTKTGKAILKNNPAVLYEQQTANLAQIAKDLSYNKKYKKLSDILSSDKIKNAGENLNEILKLQKSRKNIVYQAANPKLKKRSQRNLIKTQKTILKSKQHDQINLRRSINAY